MRMPRSVGAKHHTEKIGIGLQYGRPVHDSCHKGLIHTHAVVFNRRSHQGGITREIQLHRLAVFILRFDRNYSQRRLIAGDLRLNGLLETDHHRHRQHHHGKCQSHSGHSHDKSRPRGAAAVSGHSQPPAYHQRYIHLWI